MICILDACAMIALLRREAGEDVVWAHLSDPDNTCLAHAVNLCEVFYDFHRDAGESAAVGAVDDLKALGIIEHNNFDEAFWKDAGRLKAKGKVSLADCFAVTLTNRVGGTLLTSDHHELDPIAAASVCPITFIR
ncbi:MAG: PIN domain-containing protein [Pyrinomonadaceae bacterium]